MDAKIVKILDFYTEKFGGELIPRLKTIESEGWHLVKEFEGLKHVREDPKFHGDVSSFMHSLQVVIILQRLYAFIYFQEKHRKIDVVALETALSILPFKLSEHLSKKIGKHTRAELLFFACIFHDIGKLKNFIHLMKDVERENVKGVTRFIFHADFGRYYFEDELNSVKEMTKNFEEKLAKEQDPIKKQFYEKAIIYLVELKTEFDARRKFFEELQLGCTERHYISFLIKSHMDLSNFYNQFITAYKSRNDKDGEKLLNVLIKNLLKKVEEYGDFYVDCIILNFCDLLESAHSAKNPTSELYIFFQICMLVFVNSKELLACGKIVFKDNQLIFESKARIQHNIAALFRAFPKEKALAIKEIVMQNPDNVGGALAKAGYQKEIAEIMKILKS